MDVFGEGLRGMGMEGVGLFSIHFEKDGGVGVGGLVRAWVGVNARVYMHCMWIYVYICMCVRICMRAPDR